MRGPYARGAKDLLRKPDSLLEVSISRAGEGRWRVLGTILHRRYVRVCEALLRSREEAEAYVRDVQARREAGLDPLAGMQCVETYTIGENHERGHHCWGQPDYRGGAFRGAAPLEEDAREEAAAAVAGGA